MNYTKKLAYFILIGLLFTACSKDDESNNNSKLTMGPEYANDIYYSLQNGIVATVDRTEWDIAFYTNGRASTIITNDGNGVVLYVAGAISEWDNITTIPTVAPQYNTYSDTSWQNGAFDKGIDNSNIFDYGWGTYDMSTHTVLGDSVHVIDLGNGVVKKLIIEKRDASTSSYHIKHADLNGSNEVSDIVNTADYNSKNFINYSFANGTVNHEPASDSWDIVFTKYYNEDIPYIVTGALVNEGVKVAKVENTTIENNDYTSVSYSKAINSIGSEWKALNHDTYAYTIVNDLVYFIQDKNGNYYKLYFTAFEGSSTGNFDFELKSY